MKKFFITLFVLAAIIPVFAYAAQATTTTSTATQPPLINANLPNIPGTKDLTTGGPAALVYNLYIIALWLGGALAFGSILFAGIQYLSARGSTEAVSSAKGRIQNAILGLLLLLGMYILLSLINPDLTRLRLPTLERLPEATSLTVQLFPDDADVYACKDRSDETKILACYANQETCTQGCLTGYDPKTQANNSDIHMCVKVKGASCNVATGVSTGPSINVSCQQHAAAHPGANSCTESPAVAKVKTCITANVPGIPLTTTGGTHAGNSCHFGGRSCTDGGHAIDVGINGAQSKGKTLAQMKQTVEACGSANSVPVTCRYETSAGTPVSAGDPNGNHIHCNVDTAACGCN